VFEDRPLAVCDYSGVDRKDLVAADRVIPIRAGPREIYYLKYNHNHRWYLIPDLYGNKQPASNLGLNVSGTGWIT